MNVLHELRPWEEKFKAELLRMGFDGSDPAHDLAHVGRVVRTAKNIALSENANLSVVVPAAWFHDLINVPKDDPRRKQASRLSAQAAVEFLRANGFHFSPVDEIAHAIEAHSYSAAIVPRTLEAEIVQDADRLDGLGAIGIARCFAVAGQLGRSFYDPEDPWANSRELNDRDFTIDHFEVKLFKTVELMKTKAGKAEGLVRANRMRTFLNELRAEIN